MTGREVRPGEPEVASLLEEDVEELYEEAPCGYLSTAPDGTILRANRTFLTLGGYAPEALVRRRRFYDLLPPGAKIYYETHYAPLLQMQGHVRELALELVRADGSRLPILVNAVLKRDEDGAPLLVRITVFDASDRRRYERELLEARTEAEARAAAATALEHVAEGVVVVDDDGRIRVCNPAAERLLGATAADLIGSLLTALSPDWSSVAPRIPVGDDRQPPEAPAVIPLTFSGGTRWVAASAERSNFGVVYTLRDVTEERRLQELRDDVVTIVSHELRTPVAGVYGAAQTLLSLGETIDAETRDGLIEMIGEQSGRLARIVDEILLTQRLDAGAVAARSEAFDVGELVERVVAAASAWRLSRPVDVDLEAGARAEGDAALFEQAFVNVLDNAIKYSPPDSRVRVSVARAERFVRTTVCDEGPGVRTEERERIFEKFFRLDPEQATGTTGTGLGLYIARELVRRMHGRVSLLPSERGAAFAIELPAAR
jgi:PAS domain S-box-containing protein